MTEPANFTEIKTKIEFKATPSRNINISDFERTPTEWGENVTGVKRRFQTDKKEIALTFDACGGDYGNGYDEKLITYLREIIFQQHCLLTKDGSSKTKKFF